jgi:hypothetical protein
MQMNQQFSDSKSGPLNSPFPDLPDTRASQVRLKQKCNKDTAKRKYQLFSFIQDTEVDGLVRSDFKELTGICEG